MTRFCVAVCAAALGLLTVPTPAAAATTISAGGYPAASYVSGGGSFGLGTGTYLISLSFDQPVSDLYGWVENVISTNDYCDFGDGEVYCGGDDVSIIPLFDMVTPELYQLMITVDAPSTMTWPPQNILVRETNSDTCCTYGFEFTSGNAGHYVLSYAAIPEPATWTMMVIGFGAIGFAARRRNRLAMVTAS